VPLPEHGVITVFVTLPNTKIEFIQPLGDASPSYKCVQSKGYVRSPNNR
jgi:methylmalonyl-CoA/ethylmalonyl-CoA epimerase